MFGAMASETLHIHPKYGSRFGGETKPGQEENALAGVSSYRCRPDKQRKALSDVQNPVSQNIMVQKQAPNVKFHKKVRNLASKVLNSRPPTPGVRYDKRKIKQSKSVGAEVDHPDGTIPAPGKVVPIDEPMDVEIPSQILRNRLSRCPVDVVDIDFKNRNNHFYTSAYAKEIIDYMQARESRRSYPTKFITRTIELTGDIRAILVDWLIQLQDHEDLSEDTLFIAVSLIDRVVFKQKIRIGQLQLIGITCILIAAKLVERFPPPVAQLCHLTEDSYNKDQTLCMERVILDLLAFDINIPTSFQFLDRFIEVDDMPNEVKYASKYLIDLVLKETLFVSYSPSMIAASALYISRRLIMSMSETVAWNWPMIHYSKHSIVGMASCVSAMARALINVSTSQQTGAKRKYSSKSKFLGISGHPALENHPSLRELSMSETAV